MRAITLRQPWAQLVAVGAKTIETRSWATKYRGRLLIHASKRIARMDEARAAWDQFPLIVYEATRSTENPTRFPEEGQRCDPLPLGAVVASCTLTDCIPIVDISDLGNRNDTVVMVGEHSLRIWSEGQSLRDAKDVEPQRPFGDFSPGRFAWILDDVKPTTERCPACWGEHTPTDFAVLNDCDRCECPVCGGAGKCDPVPARGRQGLWEWSAGSVVSLPETQETQ